MYGPAGHTIVVNCEFTIYISEYPSVENSVLKYSGGVQAPVFVNYDEHQLDISGTYSATNAGEYTAIFTPKEGYGFADGAETKSVSWGIYYIWKKYTVNTTSESGYTAELSGSATIDNGTTLYSSYSISNGRFYTSGSDYFVHNYYSLISAKNNGCRYVYCNGATSLYEGVGADDSYLYVNVYTASYTTTYHYSCGSYIEDAHSTASSAYPDNNKSGDYWYVKQ